jgi:hypothetical protein
MATLSQAPANGAFVSAQMTLPSTTLGRDSFTITSEPSFCVSKL